jgi:hypothetical protein
MAHHSSLDSSVEGPYERDYRRRLVGLGLTRSGEYRANDGPTYGRGRSSGGLVDAATGLRGARSVRDACATAMTARPLVGGRLCGSENLCTDR